MDWTRLAGSALTVAASGYAMAALWASCRAPRQLAKAAAALTPGPSAGSGRGEHAIGPGEPDSPPPLAGEGPGVRAASILKPLCGDEPRLYPNLATFCRQTHPDYQLVFGVHGADDPAIAAVERLRHDYPGHDIALVVEPRTHGRNPKVGNLINMLPAARHDVLVIADSDVAVPHDWLSRVTTPLLDPRVGIVTCLYEGRATGGFWSRLGCQFIDEWFVPAVRVAQAGGSQRFGFGATIALRRDTLEAIGGFGAVAHRLADDYWLGELTRRQGLASVLADVVVTTDVAEADPRALWKHELRWLRTIRALDRRGFALTFITFTWPMLALGFALAPEAPLAVVAVLGALARTLLCRDLGAALRAPLRDLLLLAGWAAALAGSRVRWRDAWLVAESEDRLPSPAAPLPQAGEGRTPTALGASPLPSPACGRGPGGEGTPSSPPPNPSRPPSPLQRTP